MTASRPIERCRLLAPSENGGVLLWPSLCEAGAMAAENHRLFSANVGTLCGRSFAEITRMARAEMLEAAKKWTAAYHTTPAASADVHKPIFMTGHQPEMFHPGVWFKNFTLAAMARIHGAVGVNLIVDSDVVSENSLQVPGGSINEPTLERIAFDQPEPKIAFEDRRIEDRRQFLQFGRRVVERIRPLVQDPLMTTYWPLVCERAEATNKLGDCIAQARHQLEGRLGIETLEVPQSRICSGEAFQRFLVGIMARLPEFVKIHNEAIREYRRANRIRSASHPAPELTTDGDWLETPFWVWNETNLQRRRLFARHSGQETVLSDRQAWEVRLPACCDANAERAAARLLDLQQDGVRIRSRAMMTTLWARVFLSDLFIHGIGGAKYDQVTDAIIERFFGVRPPRFMVASTTLHLPIEYERAASADLHAIARRLREMEYHPECFIRSAEADELASIKRRWIDTPVTVENAKQRCAAIRNANQSLQILLQNHRQQLLKEQANLLQRLSAAQILSSREYAFCLYPERQLREFLQG